MERLREIRKSILKKTGHFFKRKGKLTQEEPPPPTHPIVDRGGPIDPKTGRRIIRKQPRQTPSQEPPPDIEA